MTSTYLILTHLAPEDAEHDGGGFFTLDQIDRSTTARPQDFAPGFLECWRAYRAPK